MLSKETFVTAMLFFTTFLILFRILSVLRFIPLNKECMFAHYHSDENDVKNKIGQSFFDCEQNNSFAEFLKRVIKVVIVSKLNFIFVIWLVR